MDKELIKKYKLEEACKRINQINEYVFYEGNKNSLITDDENDQQPQQSNNQGGVQMTPQSSGPDMNGGGMPPMSGGADMGMGGDPNAMSDGADMGMGGDPNAMPDGGDMGMGGDPNAMPDGADMGMGGDPNAMPDGADMGMGGDQMQPGDEVIDVDDLTNAQEEIAQTQESQSQQLDGVNQKLVTLAKVVDKFTKALEASDAKIADLKAEFEKRNPTEEEKIGIRRELSGPFNQKPGDVFNTMNSRLQDKNLVCPDKDVTYEITYDDIKNDSGVDKTFSDYPKDLKDYFN